MATGAAQAEAGWEERLHFDHLLANFGFEATAAAALHASKRASITLGTQLCSHGPEASVGGQRRKRIACRTPPRDSHLASFGNGPPTSGPMQLSVDSCARHPIRELSEEAASIPACRLWQSHSASDATKSFA